LTAITWSQNSAGYSGGRAADGPRVVYKNLEGAKFGDRPLDQGHADLGIGNVPGKIKCLPAQRANFLAGSCGTRITPVASDIRAGPRQCDSHRRSKPFMRAGNQGIFAVELECFEGHRTKTYIRSPRHFQIGKSLFPDGVVGAIVTSWQAP